jgi:hypothetical protein
VRRLPRREEVGILLPADALGPPVATNTIEFEWGGCPIIQHQTFFAVAVDGVDVTFANQEELELQTISAHGWWYGDDLEATGQAAHITIPNCSARPPTRSPCAAHPDQQVLKHRRPVSACRTSPQLTGKHRPRFDE